MLTPEQETIKKDRRKIYGEPLENHQGIAQMWAPLLQPHAEAIAAGRPIPAWPVALLMVALKLDRMRLVYHEDNYADIAVYLSFAREWQKSSGDLAVSEIGKKLDELEADVKALGLRRPSEGARAYKHKGFCGACGRKRVACIGGYTCPETLETQKGD